MGFRGNPQLPTQRITPPSPRLYPTHTLTPLNGIQCMLLTSTCPVAHSWNSPHCNACLLTEMCLLAFTATHPRVAKSDLNSTDAYFATKNSTKKWPKNDLKLPKIAQKLPKIAQIGPKMTQNCQNGPKMTQNGPKISTS